MNQLLQATIAHPLVLVRKLPVTSLLNKSWPLSVLSMVYDCLLPRPLSIDTQYN